MKILVIGAAGQVGGVFMRECLKNPSIEALGADIKEAEGVARMDIADAESVSSVFASFKPEAVLLASALTAVDYCETHADEARRINVAGPRIVREYCDIYSSRLVFLSTDYVFDGTSGPYSETDSPNPLNVYGKTKLEAENEVSQAGHGWIVARTSSVYSADPKSLNFLMQVIGRLSKGQSMVVPEDQFTTPTYAPDLAKSLLMMILRGCEGIYHTAGGDTMSRKDFALKICGIFGLDSSLLIAKPTSALGQPAPRPLKAGLSSEKFRQDMGYPMMGTEKGLIIARDEAKK